MNAYMERCAPAAALAGRVLIAALFVLSGWGKLGDGYGATQGYMAAMGVSGSLLPLVILLELGAGLAIVLGLWTRPAALALAGFTLVSALLFHGADDPLQRIQFMKNIAIAGGFLFLVAQGPGRWSLDARRLA